MLNSLKSLEGFTIGATDGTIGKAKDFYFDDQSWVIRYVVVDTGPWLGGRKVLVSPYGIGQPDWATKSLPINVTKERVKNSPGIDADKPVSRQHERSLLDYYGYPSYWAGTGLWGEDGYPGTMLAGMNANAFRGYLEPSSGGDTDPHLRSCRAVKGYHVHATDGDIGHIQGFIVDDHTWSIRYLIVNTSNWWGGHEVLVSPEWIQAVSWSQSKVITNLDRQTIKASPAYDTHAALNRDAEVIIYNHYDRNGYWQEKRDRAA